MPSIRLEKRRSCRSTLLFQDLCWSIFNLSPTQNTRLFLPMARMLACLSQTEPYPSHGPSYHPIPFRSHYPSFVWVTRNTCSPSTLKTGWVGCSSLHTSSATRSSSGSPSRPVRPRSWASKARRAASCWWLCKPGLSKTVCAKWEYLRRCSGPLKCKRAATPIRLAYNHQLSRQSTWTAMRTRMDSNGGAVNSHTPKFVEGERATVSHCCQSLPQCLRSTVRLVR